jgi:hypothetical protein
VVIESYGEHCSRLPNATIAHCGSSLRIGDHGGYLFLAGPRYVPFRCSYRRDNGVVVGRTCQPEPGRYGAVVGRIGRSGHRWATLEVALL